MRKTGRKKYEPDLCKDDCIFVYKLYKEVDNNVISIREASEEMVDKYGISVTTVYKLFSNMKVMDILLHSNVDIEVIKEVDNELKVLNIIKVGVLGDK